MKKKKKLDVFSNVLNVQNVSFAEGGGGGGRVEGGDYNF